MAAGDITRDTGFPKQVGNVWMVCGTIEVDNTLRSFAILDSKSYILAGVVMDQDGVGHAQVVLNYNSTNGTVAVDGSNAGPETFYYTLWYV